MQTTLLNTKFSSQKRIIWSLFFVFCIAVIVIFYLTSKVFNEKLADDLYSRATEVIDVIYYMVQTSGESPELIKGIKTLAANQDIKLIIIRSNEPPTVIASNKHALIGLPTNAIFSDEMGAESFSLNHETDQYTAISTILLENRLNNGHFVKASVGVVFDTSKKRILLQEQFLNTSFALILTMICALGIVYLLTNKYIFKPLELINSFLIKNKSKNDFTPIPIVRDDEIGSVATTLNKLFSDLYQSKISLRNQKERYELAMQGTKVGLLDWNINTGELYCSSSVFEILGCKNEGHSPTIEWLANRAHPDDKEFAHSALVSHLKLNYTYDIECRIRHENGSYIWVRARGNALRDDKGRATRMLGYFVDISKRKENEHFMHSLYILISDAKTPLDIKLNNILKETRNYLNLNAGIICKIKDQKYFVEYSQVPDNYLINSSSVLNLSDTLFSYTFKENDIVAVHDIANSNLREISANTIANINSYIAMPLYIHGRIYGTVNFFDKRIKKQPFEEREKSFVRFVSQWISNELMRTQYIDYLHESEIRLEEAVSELTNTNAELENFVYVASHDLQEPLRMITNFTGLLENTCSGQLNMKAMEYLSITSNSAKQMRQLITALLEYSRASKEDEKTQLVDLNEVLNHVCANLEKQIQESNASIINSELPTVFGNKASLISLLQNIMSNGIKFQPKNETPIIEINAKQQGGSWEISINDNGIGINQKYLSKIFEPFKRLHVKSEYKGTGIGLAICKKITDRMGSKIRVESKEGFGSTFYIIIPNQSIQTGKAA